MKLIKAITIGFAAILALHFSSCRGSKNTVDKGIDRNASLPQLNIKAEDYYKNKVEFKTFNSKATMNYQDKKQSQKLNATFKMNNEKDIWASVSAVGGIVEVVRAYITPDSLQALLPLSRDAYAMKYKDGLQLIQAELDFTTLQHLFIGNALILGAKPKHIKATDSTISIQVEKDNYLLTIIYEATTGNIIEQTIVNPSKQFSCKISQSNYKPLTDKQPFSFTRNITINNGAEEMKVDLNFSKAEIDLPLDLKFRIPDSYTIKDVKK